VLGAPSGGTGAPAPPAYPFSERREMLAFVPPAARSVLDVGCGPGGFGQSLRQHDPSRELWAVEVDEEVAAGAARFYDRLVVGAFPDALAGAGRAFDCVVFNDVLEHNVDPWAVLRSTAALLAPGGVVVASIPNVRNISVVLDLVVRGNWTYRDIGILDRTHLRFFTSRSIRALFADSGFTVEHMSGINPVGGSHFPGPRFWPFVLREFAYTGFGVRAVPR
jgi:2-polyprenyl-3-methyl-5-hydroxy-6-metoxy-1,4-benzoquinol methylase